MKHALKVAVLLNVGLTGALIFLLFHRAGGGAPGPVMTPAETRPPTPTVFLPAAPPEPFRWSQLIATDYRIYIKNLRAAGCPEPTVRAIVTADVHAVFARRSAEIERQLAALADQLGGASSEPSLRAEMAGLPAAETAKIDDLLGIKPAADPAPDPASGAPVADNVVMEPKPAAMPLAFQDIDPKAMTLTDDQLQVLNDVRQNFMKQIGGESADPNDPAYMDRWEKAQPAADEMLRFMLGTRFFQDYQMAAVGQSQ